MNYRSSRCDRISASAKMKPPFSRSYAFDTTCSIWLGREIDTIPYRLHEVLLAVRNSLVTLPNLYNVTELGAYSGYMSMEYSVKLHLREGHFLCANWNQSWADSAPWRKAFPYFMAWHSRLSTEPAHTWFRDQLRIVARSIRSK